MLAQRLAATTLARGSRIHRGWSLIAALLWAGALASPAEAQNAVDLLHAVPTTVVVSSAYRGSAQQIERLVDGDTETAWNSESGDLVGAWIEIRLPADVFVTQIRMTNGFTHVDADGNDLFEGNHRVTRVHVEHDGRVSHHALDWRVRELQTVPVSGDGGTYRIVITGVSEGERRDWQETCISELQVLGRAASARPGTQTPTTRVGPATTAPSGGVYGAADHGSVVRVSGGRFTELLPDASAYYDIEATLSGSVYAITEDGLVEVRAGRARPMPRLPRGGSARALTVDDEGQLVVLSSRGVARLRGRRWVAVDLGTTDASALRDIAVDATGDIWLLHRSEGPHRLHGGALQREAIPGASGGYLAIVAGRDGTIAVTQRTTAHRWHASTWRSVARPLDAARLEAVTVQPDGTVVVGGQFGLAAFGGTGDVRRIPLPQSGRPGSVLYLDCDDTGRLWAGVTGGILALSSTYALLRYYDLDVPSLSGTLNALVVRGSGPFH